MLAAIIMANSCFGGEELIQGWQGCISHEGEIVLGVNTAFVPNVNVVTRNYYFFHLFCPYV